PFFPAGLRSKTPARPVSSPPTPPLPRPGRKQRQRRAGHGICSAHNTSPPSYSPLPFSNLLLLIKYMRGQSRPCQTHQKGAVLTRSLFSPDTFLSTPCPPPVSFRGGQRPHVCH